MQFPLSQRRHTNIAVVRYTKNGVKLEIACYKNKVTSYRSGVENRLDEVLQVDRIFTNVGRGWVASDKDIQSVFGKETSEQEAIKFMLDHGELQVAQQERSAEMDELFKDISVIISQKCVNEKTMHPFPAQVIEQSLRSLGVVIKLDQPAKKQALAFIHQLVESHIIPIARMKMKVRCITNGNAVSSVVSWCADNGVDIVETQDKLDTDSSLGSLLVLMPPHLFRSMEAFVKAELPPSSSLHMVESSAMEEVADSISRHVKLDAHPQYVPTHSDGRKPALSDALSDEDDVPKKSKKNAKKDANRRAPQTNLTDALQNLNDDKDDSDDNRKGKKSRRKKNPPGRSAKVNQPVQQTLSDEDDSDAEVEVNRRQRKKLNRKVEEVVDVEDEEDWEMDGQDTFSE